MRPPSARLTSTDDRSWQQLYGLLQKHAPQAPSRSELAAWLLQSLNLEHDLVKKPESFINGSLGEGYEVVQGKSHPADWILAWARADLASLDREANTAVGAVLLAKSRAEALDFLRPASEQGSLQATALLAIAYDRGLDATKGRNDAALLARQVLETDKLSQADRMLMGKIYAATLPIKYPQGDVRALADAQWLLKHVDEEALFWDISTCRGPWDAWCFDHARKLLYLHPSPVLKGGPSQGQQVCKGGPRRLRGLLIGVGEYGTESGLVPVLGTANDLQYLGAALNALPYPEKHVQVLADYEVTYASVTAAINRLLAGADCQDTIWLHFSGHGNALSGLLLPGWNSSLEARGDSSDRGLKGIWDVKRPEIRLVAPDEGSLGPRDLAALVISARQAGARIVLSLDASDAAKLDLWPWMGAQSNALVGDHVTGMDYWWMAPQADQSSAESSLALDATAAMFGNLQGAFLILTPNIAVEMTEDACVQSAENPDPGRAVSAAGDKAQDCKKTFGGLSHTLATALMQDGWSTPAELSLTMQRRKIREDMVKARAVRFVTSDRDFKLVERGTSVAVENRNPLPVELIEPKAVGQSRGAGDVRIRTTDNVVKLRGRLTETPLPNLLWVNGQVAPLRDNGLFALDIPLTAAETKLTVVGVYDDGSSRHTRIDVKFEGKVEDLLGMDRYYALLIGNQDYEHDQVWKDLETPIRDIEAIGQQLRDVYGFKTSIQLNGRDVSLILKNARKDDIFRTLGALKKSLTDQDRLLIYYAGHGYEQEQRAYWIPVDGSGDPLDNFTWVDAREFTTQIKQVPAKSVLVVADSCFSGGFSLSRFGEPDAAAARERDQDERIRQAALQDMMRRTSRRLLSSGANEPVWDGGGQGHSIFARAFLTGLQKEDKPAFAAADLYHRHIMHQVTGKSEQAPQFEAIQKEGAPEIRTDW